MSTGNHGQKIEEIKSIFSKIQSQKQRYEELEAEFSKLGELDVDSVTTDSVLSLARDRAIEYTREQKKVLSEISNSIDREELKNSIDYIINSLEGSEAMIQGSADLGSLGGYISVTQKNLKSLVDEHLAALALDPLESHLHTNLNAGKTAMPGSFFDTGLGEFVGGKDAMTGQVTELSSSNARLEVKQLGQENIDRLLDQTGEQGGFAQVPILESKNPKPKLFGEPNPYKSQKTLDRINFGLHYNALLGPSEGILMNLQVGFRQSQYLLPYSGLILRRNWGGNTSHMSEGYGFQGGIRVNLGEWFMQPGIEIIKPSGPSSQAGTNVETGKPWFTYPILAFGRQVKISSRIHTVFSGYFDPLFNRERSQRLHSKMFGLRIGLEFN